MTKAFTLIEVVVSIGVFATLATVGSVLLFTILRGSKKAESVALVRTEGAYVLNSMSSAVRFASRIDSCTASTLTFRAADNLPLTYSCLTHPDTNQLYIASNSARLSSSAVKLTSCNVFVCSADKRSVKIDFTLTRAQSGTAESSAQIPFSTEVVLRNR